MVSGQLLTIALRLVFDYGTVGREVGCVVRIVDRAGAFEVATPPLAPVSLAWEYADHPANDAQPRDVDVDRVVARLFAERAKQEAVRLNREGRYDQARHALAAVQARVGDYAGSDTELNALVGELSEEQVHYAAPMPEAARKAAYFQSSTRSRMRTMDGKSKKA
jgi:hypothetical protein